MSDTKALVTVNQMTIDEVMTIGKTMASSGYFSDAKQAAQAVVKILAGREMGFGPFASMTGINIIKGKPAIGGNLMAAAVKAHPKYSYQVVTLDADTCELAFFEGNKELGRSIFTKGDAAAAETGKLVAPGAKGNMMKRFARNMLFNRAMSNGVRWYCPDVFLGAPVYTPDELGATVNASGDIIDVTPTVTKQAAKPAAQHTNGAVGYEDTTSAPPPKAVAPEEWDTLPIPESYTDLYYRVHELGIDDADPAGRRKHAAAIIKKTYPDNGASAADAWQAIITYQQAKQADADGAE